MEQPRVERTLRLMRLMSGIEYLTVEQLARRLDTSTRSIHRYIDAPELEGYVRNYRRNTFQPYTRLRG